MNNPAFGGTVPVPNRFFDELLPNLSDCELRVLLVIVRATLGWREGSDRGGWRYKRRDWLTNRLLMKRTGCGSASISRAVHSLASAGLIRVENAEGDLLKTPEQRRRNLGRIYFALGDKWITAPPRDNEGARTTTSTRDNNIGAVAHEARQNTGFVHVGQLVQRAHRTPAER